MNSLLRLCIVLAFATALTAHGQYLFSVTFRGTNYEANASGQIVPTVTTEETVLKEIAQRNNIADPKTLALVYHVAGWGSYGDTLEAVQASSGAPVDPSPFLGLLFGDDPTFNRIAVTNAAGTEIRRVDFLYTFQNTHSMGAGFTTKRYVPDAAGNKRVTFEGQLHWHYLPTGSYGTRICTGTWTTTRPFTPR